MPSKTHITLQNTEGFITQAAARIYAAYLSLGKIDEGAELEWIERSVKEAIEIAKATDRCVVAEREMS